MRSPRRFPTLFPVFAVLVVLVVAVIAVRARLGGGAGHARDASSVTLLADDFSTGNGWATYSSETGGLSYSDGGYRLRLDRPADDGLSVVVLPGNGVPSVAASAVVVNQSTVGGLIGVGCAAGMDQVYLGAVDPATSGFVIVRVNGTVTRLLRSGADEQGSIRGVGEQNELQIQCRFGAAPEPHTLIRLFSSRRLVASYQDVGGFRSFRGMALGGISAWRPLQAVFSRVALQALPASPDTSVAAACDRVTAVESMEADYGWLVGSGGTRLNTPDFDSRQVLRIVSELGNLSAGVEADARLLPAAGTGRQVLRSLAGRLRAQRASLDSLTNAVNRGPVDAGRARVALTCPTPEGTKLPRSAAAGQAAVPQGARSARRAVGTQEFDEKLTRSLPAPVFVVDPTLPAEPLFGVDATLRYDTYRVFGESVGELTRSLRLNGIHVRGDLAYAVTNSRFEDFYRPAPRQSGCVLVPDVRVSLVITFPEWEAPDGVDRYLSNQWNQFMWDLDWHERHHAALWIKGANRMAAIINETPSGPSCDRLGASAKARLSRVFSEYERRQRQFDRDVGAGRLPAPSLP
jgi:predicted secreted Zn-dependent protease